MDRKPAKSFEDLIVWQKAHAFVLSIYQYSRELPKDELYGLVSQMRRSAVSIPANIVEGFKKKGKADKLRYLNIAQGSLEECRYYLILSRDLGFKDCPELFTNNEEIGKLLEAYSTTIRKSIS